MSNSDAGGCLSVLMIIGTVASWLGSGVLAWDWVEPDSFGTAILFLIAWGILGKVFDFVLGLIIMGIASMLE
jgi:hypothetical protein